MCKKANNDAIGLRLSVQILTSTVARAAGRMGILVAAGFFSLCCFAQEVYAQSSTVSLSDFGAVGDGIANDGPALQAALDSLADNGGGTLLVPAGKYAIMTPVSVNFSGPESSILIKGIESSTQVDTTLNGNQMAKGLDLVSEFYPRTGSTQVALSFSGLTTVGISDIAFVGNPTATTDALITLNFGNVEDATIQHCEFYGLSSLWGAIVSASRSRLHIENTKFLGSTGNSGVYVPVVQNLEWKGFSLKNSLFIDYGTRPNFFGKLAVAAPFAWVNIGNAAQTTNDSPRREVEINKVFLDEGGYTGVASVPLRYQPASASIDLVYITGLRMNVSNLGTWGNYLTSVRGVLIENSKYGWSHNASAAVNLVSVDEAILDKLECTESADRIYADTTTDKLTVLNSVYSVLDSSARVTNVVNTEAPEDDPVQFVRQRFETVLQRSPDPAAHFYWSKRLIDCGQDSNCVTQQQTELDSYLEKAPVANFGITGQVTADGTPLPNAQVTLSGSQTATTQTDDNGNFSFSRLPTSGIYNVSVSKRHYTFSTPTTNISHPSTDQNLELAGSLDLFTLSGHVTNLAGQPVSDTTITLQGSEEATVTTDVNGNYSFANIPAGGDYTVTPSNLNFLFSPANRQVTDLSNDQILDFNLVTHTIQGRIRQADGVGVSGVAIKLEGSVVAETTTDALGNYLFINVPAGGAYIVSPLTDFVITPSEQSIPKLNHDETLNFILVTHTISGKVSDVNGAVVAGASVTLSGSSAAVGTTNSQGNYSIANVPAGGTYTITASKPNYTFTPGAVTLSDLASDQIQNFDAKLNFGVPVLLCQPNSNRAVALDSVLHANEPFATKYQYPWGIDNQTRIILFVDNFKLRRGEGVEALTADAEDAAGHHYKLRVEYVGLNSDLESVHSVIVRLADELGDVGDVLIQVTYRGIASNRVRIGIGHIGGGPADDH